MREVMITNMKGIRNHFNIDPVEDIFMNPRPYLPKIEYDPEYLPGKFH